MRILSEYANQLFADSFQFAVYGVGGNTERVRHEIYVIFAEVK